MEKCEFGLHSPSGDGTAVFSPVSGLAAAFSSQSLDTPRRRLSLDTDTSSGTPDGTSGRLAVIVETVTPDSSHLSSSDDDSPTAVVMDDAATGGEGDACVGSANFRSSRSSSGSGGEDLRTPGVPISPAPSPVFAVDEDSRDSGYDGETAAPSVPAGTTLDDGLFLHPLTKGTRTRKLTSFKLTDDGFDATEDGMFEEAMQVDDATNSLPVSWAEPIACLLQKEIVYEGDKRSADSTVSESSSGTPLKRKTHSGRLTRCLANGQESSLKRSTYNNKENDDEESYDSRLDLRGQPELKRRKSLVESRFTSLRVPFKPLNRSHSEADAWFALHKDDNCHLIGDHSMPHALPIMDRPHVHDLKCISIDTLKRLITGEFAGIVHDYMLVDCRYPYEYDGGHIKGAINVYTQEQLTAHMLNESVMAAAADCLGESRRQIYVFYCEFSRERGPRMTRFLRKRDRQLNEHQYPKLFYPEIYLLDGGYKNFYAMCSDMCEPQSYRPMHDEDHVAELRKFRSKSKSWCSSGGEMSDGAQMRRPGLNRGLFSSK